MNADQFQQILDMLDGAGQGAFWLAVLWIAKGYVVTVVWGVVACVIASTVRRIFFVGLYGASLAERLWAHLGLPGTFNGYGTDRKILDERLQELLQQRRGDDDAERSGTTRN